MKNLWWLVIGTGNHNLILLYGWGLNTEIWSCIQEKLTLKFTLYLIDLPGFGRSLGYGALSLDEMTLSVLECAPKKAIWLGWSLGGLVASLAALTHPERVQALVTVASSPRFSAHGAWPGIKLEVLAGFQLQLSDDFHRTVERFLALLTMGIDTVRLDTRMLKLVMSTLPIPSVEVLNGGLEILKTSDLREALAALRVPHLRLYGYLDSLVPRAIAPLLDNLWPRSRSIIIAKSAHAPFISHPSKFCALLITALTQYLS